MSKKLFPLLLIFTLIFSFAACGDEKDKPDSNSKEKTTATDSSGEEIIIGDNSSDDKYSGYTEGQANAMKEIEFHIEKQFLSKQKILESVKPETATYGPFTYEDLVFAVDNYGVDWVEQATAAAEAWLEYGPKSYESVVKILVEDKLFTQEEAEQGAAKIDWNEQALKYAQNYVENNSVSYIALIGVLERDNFTTEQATYAADNCGADWKEEALEISHDLIKRGSLNYNQLIDMLTDAGFTAEEAKYAADNSEF